MTDPSFFIDVDDEALERLIEAHGRALKAARDERHRRRIAAAPYAVGDIVEVLTTRSNAGWRRFRITAVKPWSKTSWSFEGAPQKKDGDWSKQSQHLYGDIRKAESP